MVSRADKQTASIKQDIFFSDFLNSFSSNPFSGALSKIINETSVKQSIKNIVLTDRYERLYQPNFGGNIKAFLFEQMDNFTTNQIREYIKQTILNFEDRVENVSVIVTPDYDKNTYKVNIYFSLINTSNISSMELILKRTR